MSGDYFLFLIIFVSLACMGFRKILGSTDPEGKIKKGVVAKILTWLS
jgi:hypothetical protein